MGKGNPIIKKALELVKTEMKKPREISTFLFSEEDINQLFSGKKNITLQPTVIGHDAIEYHTLDFTAKNEAEAKAIAGAVLLSALPNDIAPASIEALLSKGAFTFRPDSGACHITFDTGGQTLEQTLDRLKKLAKMFDKDNTYTDAPNQRKLNASASETKVLMLMDLIKETGLIRVVPAPATNPDDEDDMFDGIPAIDPIITSLVDRIPAGGITLSNGASLTLNPEESEFLQNSGKASELMKVAGKILQYCFKDSGLKVTTDDAGAVTITPANGEDITINKEMVQKASFKYNLLGTKIFCSLADNDLTAATAYQTSNEQNRGTQSARFAKEFIPKDVFQGKFRLAENVLSRLGSKRVSINLNNGDPEQQEIANDMAKYHGTKITFYIKNMQHEPKQKRPRVEERAPDNSEHLLRQATALKEAAGKAKRPDTDHLKPLLNYNPPQSAAFEGELLKDAIIHLAAALDVRYDATLTTAGASDETKESVAMQRKLAEMLLSTTNVKRAALGLGLTKAFGDMGMKEQQSLNTNKDAAANAALVNDPKVQEFLREAATNNPGLLVLVDAAVEPEKAAGREYAAKLAEESKNLDEHRGEYSGMVVTPAMEIKLGAVAHISKLPELAETKARVRN